MLILSPALCRAAREPALPSPGAEPPCLRRATAPMMAANSLNPLNPGIIFYTHTFHLYYRSHINGRRSEKEANTRRSDEAIHRFTTICNM